MAHYCMGAIMDVMEAIRTRRSIRAYQDRPVEEEKLVQVIEAGRLAPSARNLQDWKFIIIKDKQKRTRLSEATRGQSFVAAAPVVIAACGTEIEYIMTCGQYCYPIDVAIAVNHMTLEAIALGLVNCWIGAFYEGQVKEILEIPDNVRVVVMLTLGYPAESPFARPRKNLEEIMAYEKWRD